MNYQSVEKLQSKFKLDKGWEVLDADFVILSDTTKGGISGDRKGSMVEYLSIL